MEVTERRVVYQQWYETEYSKTGWDSHGWSFDDGTSLDSSWIFVESFFDKFGNPHTGIVERKVILNGL